MILKKILFYYFIILFLLTACSATPPNSSLQTIKVGGQQVKVEMADTLQSRTQGLSGRQSLPQNQGMLFVFNNYSRPSFWMKDMLFPIDIIWIKDDQVVDITKNIPPSQKSEKLKNYFPKQEINYVLEVNAGWCDKHQIEVEDSVVMAD